MRPSSTPARGVRVDRRRVGVAGVSEPATAPAAERAPRRSRPRRTGGSEPPPPSTSPVATRPPPRQPRCASRARKRAAAVILLRLREEVETATGPRNPRAPVAPGRRRGRDRERRGRTAATAPVRLGIVGHRDGKKRSCSRSGARLGVGPKRCHTRASPSRSSRAPRLARRRGACSPSERARGLRTCASSACSRRRGRFPTRRTIVQPIGSLLQGKNGDVHEKRRGRRLHATSRGRARNVADTVLRDRIAQSAAENTPPVASPYTKPSKIVRTSTTRRRDGKKPAAPETRRASAPALAGEQRRERRSAARGDARARGRSSPGTRRARRYAPSLKRNDTGVAARPCSPPAPVGRMNRRPEGDVPDPLPPDGDAGVRSRGRAWPVGALRRARVSGPPVFRAVGRAFARGEDHPHDEAQEKNGDAGEDDRQPKISENDHVVRVAGDDFRQRPLRVVRIVGTVRHPTVPRDVRIIGR